VAHANSVHTVMQNTIFGINPNLAAVLVLCAFSAAIYYPGLAGPFIFDDQANILSNPYISVHRLDLSTLFLSAASGSAGPLGRPIPMMTFALNYFFSGGFNHTLGFKLTNLIIHIINGFLVFQVFRLLIYLQQRQENKFGQGILAQKGVGYVTLVLAVFWTIHPIQTNAVLYIVQRMTTLSAFFVLLGLISYLIVRTRDNLKSTTKYILISTIPVFLILGLLSKENAILLLPFILLIEVFFFRESRVLKFLKQWHPWSAIILIVAGIVALLLLINYSLPGYSGRDFNLLQRLMTETRVLVFYLSLIFLPLLYKFSLFHDDITVSTGLLLPATTLYSLLLLASITTIAIIYRKKYPCLLFGWLWFLVAHSLESTFIPLELAHEHRNYIALVGPLFASTGLIDGAIHRLSRAAYLLIFALLFSSLTTITYLRSTDWSSYQDLIVTESSYHPDSPRAQAALGSLLVSKHLLPQGLEAMTRAHELQPGEPGFVLNMLMINHMMGRKDPNDWRKSILDSFQKKPVSPLSMQVLDYAYDCTNSVCRDISSFIQSLIQGCWNNTLNSPTDRSRCMYYDGLLANRHGHRQYAIQRFRDSARLDKDFLRPIMQIALVQLENSNYTGARATIEKLIQKNEQTRFKKYQGVNNLIALYNKTTQGAGLVPLKPVID
jgi:hypothetical protein